VAATRASGRTGIAVLTLTPASAAIAIAGRGKILASREFPWAIRRGYSELLDRCLIVSEVAPQLKHLIDLVRPVHGVTVSKAIACGTLPDLRSISMLLIDEMDFEVETIDPPDVLDEPVQPQATSTWRRPALMVAALMLLSSWSFLQVAGSSPVTPLFARGPEAVAVTTPVVPDLQAEATMGRISAGATSPEPAVPHSPVSEPPPSVAVPAPVALTPIPQRVPPPPLPRVDGIMIAGTRRLAIVDGIVVEPGDRVGARVVSSIERDGVVLVDSSGRAIFVAIRARKPPTGPS
jgi:hypothetical protein